MTALEFTRANDWTSAAARSRADLHLAGVWRTAVWFNWMWPGSLTPEANGCWRTHGPLGRRRWRWRLVMGLARLGTWFWPRAWSPGRWGVSCRPKPVLLPIWWFNSRRNRMARHPRLKWYALAALAGLAAVAALAAPQFFHRHPPAALMARLDRLGLIPGLGGGAPGSDHAGAGDGGGSGGSGSNATLHGQPPAIRSISSPSNGDGGPQFDSDAGLLPDGLLSTPSQAPATPGGDTPQAGNPPVGGGSGTPGFGGGGGGAGGGDSGSMSPTSTPDPMTPVVFTPPATTDTSTPPDGGPVLLQPLPTPSTTSPPTGPPFTPTHFSIPDITPSGPAPPQDPPTTHAAAIPEPASWLMLIAGFGVIGGALRRRRALVKGRFCIQRLS